MRTREEGRRTYTRQYSVSGAPPRAGSLPLISLFLIAVWNPSSTIQHSFARPLPDLLRLLVLGLHTFVTITKTPWTALVNRYKATQNTLLVKVQGAVHCAKSEARCSTLVGKFKSNNRSSLKIATELGDRNTQTTVGASLLFYLSHNITLHWRRWSTLLIYTQCIYF